MEKNPSKLPPVFLPDNPFCCCIMKTVSWNFNCLTNFQQNVSAICCSNLYSLNTGSYNWEVPCGEDSKETGKEEW